MFSKVAFLLLSLYLVAPASAKPNQVPRLVNQGTLGPGLSDDGLWSGTEPKAKVVDQNNPPVETRGLEPNPIPPPRKVAPVKRRTAEDKKFWNQVLKSADLKKKKTTKKRAVTSTHLKRAQLARYRVPTKTIVRKKASIGKKANLANKPRRPANRREIFVVNRAGVTQ